MTRFVVLLRGVNVGAHNRISMPDLRSLLEGQGCSDVVTYLQSGNAVVGWSGSSEALRGAVTGALTAELGLHVQVLVRTSAQLDAVVAGNPFDVDDPTRLHVAFLSGPPPPVDADALLPDRVAPGPEVLYVAYAGGSQGSKAAKLLTGKQLGVIASARNWRTVLALQELARGQSA